MLTLCLTHCAIDNKLRAPSVANHSKCLLVIIFRLTQTSFAVLMPHETLILEHHFQ